MTAPTGATRHCLSLEVSVTAPQEVGATEFGVRRWIPISGGTFSGDIAGEVVSGGADWQWVLPSGAIELSAHYALKTDRGAFIEVHSNGVRVGPPEVLARLARGEAVPASEYYFRTHMRFQTAAPELAHWNTRLFYSIGERQGRLVKLAVFEIL
jgi:Protein of unknown function (DUF3237)